MKDAFTKLLNFLQLEDYTQALPGRLIELTVDDTRREWFFHVEFNRPLPIKTFKHFEERLKDVPKQTSTCHRVRYKIEYVAGECEEPEAYYRHVLETMIPRRPRYAALSEFDIERNSEGGLCVVCPQDGAYVESMLYDIENALSDIGFTIPLSVRYCEQSPSIAERIERLDALETLEAEREHGAKGHKTRFIHHRNRTVRKVSHRIQDIPVDEDALARYKSEHHKADFTIEARIINIEERKINQKTTLFIFVLSDDEDSVYVKKFVRDQDEYAFLKGAKPQMLMRVQGAAQHDTFVDEVLLTAVTIERTDHPVFPELREDTAKTARVELHLHTKMSTLDGIDHIEDYVDAALRFKHPAIALTDHNSAQAFPEFFKAVKNKPIKPIYGVEFNVIDEDETRIVLNPPQGHLKDALYTVFDIETTGLSVHFSHIIEISAIKIKDHQVVDRYDTFIKPPVRLSEQTKRFTGIRQEDVDAARPISEVLPAFAAFIKGTVLVAHNARFDVSHINENERKLGLPVTPYPAVDTLQIARQFYGDKLARFNLKSLAKFFKVELKRHHRAEYDTRATADIFMHMLTDLDRFGFKTFADLAAPELRMDGFNPFANAMSRHLSVLVQTQAGLKNLYRLVSLANTKYYERTPRLPTSVIKEYREGLLIGSGCINGDFFETVLNRGEAEALEKAKFYDYLEIQPLEDARHRGRDIDDIDHVITETHKRIIKIGQEIGIPVVATGDVHHIEKQAVKYRDIYVQTPVVGGGLHALHGYADIPSQYFRTTPEMLEAFQHLGDETAHDIVVDNTRALADTIETVEAFHKTLFVPTDDFLAREGIPSVEKKMLSMVHEKARSLYGDPLPPLVADRLHKELNSITENKFSTVYFISHLLVRKSLDEGYLVGSRGSVGSSLVATLMDITEVNPLPPHYICPKCHFSSFKMSPDEKTRIGIRPDERGVQSLLEDVASGFDLNIVECPACGYPLNKDGHDIPFETFLGFKGDKVPDIDLNFSGDYQPVVHEYIRKLFGKDHAFRAGTISTVADKTAFGYVKGYVEKKGLTLRKAEIDRRAKVIAGVKRSTGQHPGGIVVVPNYKDIHDVTPVQFPADDVTSNWKTTHFDYHSFEDNLFKLDVLGHDDPTMIHYLMDFVRGDPISFPFKEAQDIPLDDAKVYKLLSGTDVIGLKPKDIQSEVASFGVPEMGTPFVRGMLTDSRPKTFADIVKISGLSHGTDVWLNNAKTLVTGKNVKYGRIPFKDVIGCRDDIMIYLIRNGLKSEIAFEISEFIRRGRGSSHPEQWEGYGMIMREHGIPEWYIWSAGQIKYLFPKAHATAYVIMALRIAWFKVHRPIYFYSAYFSRRARDFDLLAFQGGEYAIEKRMREIDDAGARASDVDKRLYTVLEVALEMVKRGYSFVPVDIFKSDARDFKICRKGSALRLPFIALDGLGMKAGLSIVEARTDKLFTSREDIRERTALSTTLFDKLDALGAFGELPETGQINLFDIH